MCICINCKYVNNCSIYNLVEDQHSQGHISNQKKNIFSPYLSVININIITNIANRLDWDVVECLSYIEKPGEWLNQDIKI
uniref:Conserved hypothetical plastid protein n=1 Tax=Bangiopsis subsimplex TaxID=139980 RepID=A0A1C9CCM5_9RHOD|nr:hypothetical protein Bangp_054 [Bangiopsis subsimplex]AOM66136.1 hypothetical protein Bangp_054 [Bangiopsis subsimplex]ARO90307.1 conserved hypothetical plastid protein [Bangiopsis subsimplex]